VSYDITSTLLPLLYSTPLRSCYSSGSITHMTDSCLFYSILFHCIPFYSILFYSTFLYSSSRRFTSCCLSTLALHPSPHLFQIALYHPISSYPLRRSKDASRHHVLHRSVSALPSHRDTPGGQPTHRGYHRPLWILRTR
jgi:hypothetical protein